MARLMLSAGMFSALAAATAVRSRGLPSTSPPPPLAAMVISLIRRVNILPRLASSAPFLCLIVAHFEWPDMVITSTLRIFSAAELQTRQAQQTHENKVDYTMPGLLRCIVDSAQPDQEPNQTPVPEPAAEPVLESKADKPVDRLWQ